MKIKNIAIEIRIELGAFENMSFSVACRFSLADFFFDRQFFSKHLKV